VPDRRPIDDIQVETDGRRAWLSGYPVVVDLDCAGRVCAAWVENDLGRPEAELPRSAWARLQRHLDERGPQPETKTDRKIARGMELCHERIPGAGG